MGLAVLAAACTRPATQLVVLVDSDIAALVEVHASVVPVDAPVSDVASDATFTIGSTLSVPFSFGVTPPGGEVRRRVEVVVEGRLAAGGPAVVVRRVRTGFLEGQRLLLPIFLADSCRSVDCSTMGADLSCDRGICVSTDVAPETLAPVVPGQETRDAGTAATDAAGAPGCGTLFEIESSGRSPVALSGFPDVPRYVAAFHDGSSAMAYFLESGGGVSDPIPLFGPATVDGVAAVALAGGSDAIVAFSRTDDPDPADPMVGPGIFLYRVSLAAPAMTPIGSWPGHHLVGGGSGARYVPGAAFLVARDGRPEPSVLVVGEGDPFTVHVLPTTAGDADGWITESLGGNAFVALGTDGATPGCSLLFFQYRGVGHPWSPLMTLATPCSRVAAVELRNGEILVAWSNATAAPGTDAVSYVLATHDGGDTFTSLGGEVTLAGSRDGRAPGVPARPRRDGRVPARGRSGRAARARAERRARVADDRALRLPRPRAGHGARRASRGADRRPRGLPGRRLRRRTRAVLALSAQAPARRSITKTTTPVADT